MKNCSHIVFSFLMVFVLHSFLPRVFAASPDGNGPWADTVVSSNQGLMKNGLAVPGIRSNPQSALGIAENNTTEGNFFSLGFGGVLTLGFVNGISSGVVVVEATNPNYPQEQAKVEVSSDGQAWLQAGSLVQDGSVSLPQGVECVRYVRITDSSNVDQFSDGIADGYDVDGVKAEGKPCKKDDGGTSVVIDQSTLCSTQQTNTTSVQNLLNTKSKTGKNKANNNTSGSVALESGNSTSETTVTVDGGQNTLQATCCSTKGDIAVTVAGNGSQNKAELAKKKPTKTSK